MHRYVFSLEKNIYPQPKCLSIYPLALEYLTMVHGLQWTNPCLSKCTRPLELPPRTCCKPSNMEGHWVFQAPVTKAEAQASHPPESPHPLPHFFPPCPKTVKWWSFQSLLLCLCPTSCHNLKWHPNKLPSPPPFSPSMNFCCVHQPKPQLRSLIPHNFNSGQTWTRSRGYQDLVNEGTERQPQELPEVGSETVVSQPCRAQKSQGTMNRQMPNSNCVCVFKITLYIISAKNCQLWCF